MSAGTFKKDRLNPRYSFIKAWRAKIQTPSRQDTAVSLDPWRDETTEREPAEARGRCLIQQQVLGSYRYCCSFPAPTVPGPPLPSIPSRRHACDRKDEETHLTA